MPTLHQLWRQPRQSKKRINLKTVKRPQKKAICLRVFKQSPKKPNSANRSVAKLRLRNGRILVAKIGGEGHNLQEHSVVLVRRGRAKDLPAVRHYIIRGALDLVGSPDRKQSRSKYGTPRPKTKLT